ncbi:MAG: hypothetical protein ACK4L7_06615 [Flavobacteriales bacterium]
MRQSIILAILLSPLAAQAQSGKTPEGYALQWDKTITVIPDSLSIGAFKLPAWSIAVHEADASTVMGWLQTDMSSVSTGISKGKPAKAMGLRLPQVPGAAMAAADASNDRKAGLARLTIAFAINDSTPTPSTDGQEAYMRELAVKYNRAAVQQQIEDYEKQLAKASDKLSSSKDDVAKSQSRIAKSSSQQAKTQAQRAKVERSNARISGEIAGLEKKFALSNSPKDLKRLTKARQQLAKGESELAKLLQKESKIQGDIAKEQGRMSSYSSKADERGASKEEILDALNALRRKQDAIR